jgi:hypothetical protein
VAGGVQEGCRPCPPHNPVEFSQRAVELARTGGKPVAALAKDLGISESCLRNWMAQADADDGGRADRLTSVEKRNSPSCAGVTASWKWKMRSSCGRRPTSHGRTFSPGNVSVGP